MTTAEKDQGPQVGRKLPGVSESRMGPEYAYHVPATIPSEGFM